MFAFVCMLVCLRGFCLHVCLFVFFCLIWLFVSLFVGPFERVYVCLVT